MTTYKIVVDEAKAKWTITRWCFATGMYVEEAKVAESEPRPAKVSEFESRPLWNIYSEGPHVSLIYRVIGDGKELSNARVGMLVATDQTNWYQSALGTVILNEPQKMSFPVGLNWVRAPDDNCWCRFHLLLEQLYPDKMLAKSDVVEIFNKPQPPALAPHTPKTEDVKAEIMSKVTGDLGDGWKAKEVPAKQDTARNHTRAVKHGQRIRRNPDYVRSRRRRRPRG